MVPAIERMEIVVDSMLAEISNRATRLHAIQFGAHLKTRPSFPEVTYDGKHYAYQNGRFVQRAPGKTQDKGRGTSGSTATALASIISDLVWPSGTSSRIPEPMAPFWAFNLLDLRTAASVPFQCRGGYE